MANRLLLSIFCALILTQCVLAQTPKDVAGTFHKKETRFIDYIKDFKDFSNGGEWEPSNGLREIAAINQERAASGTAWLAMYDNLSCPQDRTSARTAIQREFTYYMQGVNIDIEFVNKLTGTTEKPGVATEAIRMRDDLRELQELFKSTKLP